MKIIVDTHTHTIASGHAYNTVQEMIEGALKNGIEMIAITDHGPAMPGATNWIYFANLKEIPDEVLGIKVLKGAEANIIDYTGKLDIPNKVLEKLDFRMAAFHDICILPSTVEEHTNTMIDVIKNPNIDAIAHPGNPRFQVDIVKVVEAAKEYDKLIEINNHSFKAREGSESNCREFALRCKEMGVKIVCGSDAHISCNIGKFDKVYEILRQIDFPEELILNCSVNRVYDYLNSKKKKSVKSNPKKIVLAD